jgi:hypothetical protein
MVDVELIKKLHEREYSIRDISRMSTPAEIWSLSAG